MVQINNGYRFPTTVKAAVIAEINSNPTKRRAAIAVERNMSTGTVARWARAEVGCALSNHQHPKTAAAVAERWAAYKTQKAFNTATPIMDNGTQVITFKGKIYR